MNVILLLGEDIDALKLQRYVFNLNKFVLENHQRYEFRKNYPLFVVQDSFHLNTSWNKFNGFDVVMELSFFGCLMLASIFIIRYSWFVCAYRTVFSTVLENFVSWSIIILLCKTNSCSMKIYSKLHKKYI